MLTDQASGPDTSSLVRRRVRPLRPTIAIIVLALGLCAPLFLSSFNLGLLALWLPLVLLALSIDLLWGENRIISFGHGAVFAAGGYLAGLILKGPDADTSGGNLELLGQEGTEPGLYSTALEHLHAPDIAGVPILALVIPTLACALVGLVIGAALFRIPSVEVYAPLITLGIGVIAATAFIKIPEIGGSNGLTSIPSFLVNQTGNTQVYLFNLSWVALIYLAYWGFRSHRIGRIWRAAGDDPHRLETLGMPVRRIRTIGFAASSALAGLAGALYAGTAGVMSADSAGVMFSVQALIWVAVAVPGTLLAPLIGVLAIKAGEHHLSGMLHNTWQLALGLLLILVVLIRPERITQLTRRRRIPGQTLSGRQPLGKEDTAAAENP